MFKKLTILAMLSLAFVATSSIAQAQYSTLQFEVGGYGTGVRVVNYGNNGAYYGYQNSYGSPYYGNSYNSYYGNYNGQYGGNGYYNNNVGYYSYPSMNYGYVAPRLYRAPMPGFAMRRGRW